MTLMTGEPTGSLPTVESVAGFCRLGAEFGVAGRNPVGFFPDVGALK